MLNKLRDRDKKKIRAPFYGTLIKRVKVSIHDNFTAEGWCFKEEEHLRKATTDATQPPAAMRFKILSKDDRSRAGWQTKVLV
jgi:hypothetical protein